MSSTVRSLMSGSWPAVRGTDSERPGVTMPSPKSMLWYQPRARTLSSIWFRFTRDGTLASEDGSGGDRHAGLGSRRDDVVDRVGVARSRAVEAGDIALRNATYSMFVELGRAP